MWRIENSQIITVTILGISIHILLLITVFDTYFKSPLEHGMSSVKSTSSPASKRVVLFVADGLRAEAILDENENRTPFLTNVRKNRGSWGVSHTRVPTESRPGHVAMLAGIFEDPSAIFQGWKHNPVDFDSVINQSRNAWCMGSPDIVPIFNRDKRKHIHTYSYNAEMQDFGNKDTISLDRWVFKRTESILSDSKDSKLLNESENVFFLHLLGLDTAGHAFKPFSNEYSDNIRFVDENVKKMERLFTKTFPDGLTSFIFTSDHGMTDWGSHGSGLDHETFTPIIAWGAGIKPDKTRKDLKQIDIAPLISSLIGLNYPTNNMGRLPVNFLSVSSKNKLDLFLNNVYQIFKIFYVKQQKIEGSTFYYKPYEYLTLDSFERKYTELWHSNESFEIVFEKCDRFFNEILIGMNYYHTYFMGYILFFVSLGLFFWILYLSTYIFVDFKTQVTNKQINILVQFVPVVYSLLMILMCKFQSFPILYYVYFIFPGIMSYLMLNRISKISNISFQINCLKCFYFLFFACCILLFIFGFLYRFCFSFMMILISFSIFLNPGASRKIHTRLKVSWILICVVLSIFPLLPLMFTKFNLLYFVLGCCLWQWFIYFIANKNSLSFEQLKIFRIQKWCHIFSFLNALIISMDIFEHTSMFKYVSWFLFLIPLGTIPFSTTVLEIRIKTIIMSFGSFYILTTMSYELIFLTFYSLLLLLLMEIEQKLTTDMYRELESFRRCLIFVALILLGFFGTGNIASLNSFDPMWVRCFLTVFSPFTMTVLIFLKLIIPFLFTACVFRNIVLKTGTNLTSSFCIILLISDIMVFYFMYHIKNVGSWLEIGMSLSHFVVVECLTIGILVLYFIAFLLTNVEFSESISNKPYFMKKI